MEDANPFQLQQAINQIRGLGNKEFLKFSSDMRQGRKNQGVLNNKFYEIPPFDIYAVFGDHTDPNANHTVYRIKEVYLTGQSQVISSNGQPIQEQYSFIARDIGAPGEE